MIPTPHTITHKRPSFTKDASGGKVPDLATQANLKGFVQNASTDMVEDYRKREIKITHSVYFNSDPSVQPEDVFVFNGKNLFIKATHDLCNLNKAFHVLCEERK